MLANKQHIKIWLEDNLNFYQLYLQSLENGIESSFLNIKIIIQWSLTKVKVKQIN